MYPGVPSVAPVAGDRRLAIAPREPEVDQLDAIERAVDEEEVARLEVAVDDARGVRSGERLGGADRERHDLGEGQPRSREPRREALALEPLHDQVRLLRLEPVGEVTDDPGVIEPREARRLALEALQILDAAAVEHLDRDALAGLPIERAVDHPHAAGAGEVLDLEPPSQHLAALHRASIPSARPPARAPASYTRCASDAAVDAEGWDGGRRVGVARANAGGRRRRDRVAREPVHRPPVEGEEPIDHREALGLGGAAGRPRAKLLEQDARLGRHDEGVGVANPLEPQGQILGALQEHG